MQTAEKYVVERGGSQTEIRCELLPWFDRTDLEGVRCAFASAPALPFQQAWLTETEPGFVPGEVRLGWRGSSLMVLAQLTDQDIFNAATRLNQPAWELGDVFEMFFKSAKIDRYVEFQVTPQNQRLQLMHPVTRTAEWSRHPDEFNRCLIWTDVFHSQTWVQTEENRWQVYAEIPAETICGSRDPLENISWLFSFGRYDYTRGTAEPVISSTSSHAKPDFHRQHEWGIMHFRNSLILPS